MKNKTWFFELGKQTKNVFLQFPECRINVIYESGKTRVSVSDRNESARDSTYDVYLLDEFHSGKWHRLLFNKLKDVWYRKRQPKLLFQACLKNSKFIFKLKYSLIINMIATRVFCSLSSEPCFWLRRPFIHDTLSILSFTKPRLGFNLNHSKNLAIQGNRMKLEIIPGH